MTTLLLIITSNWTLFLGLLQNISHRCEDFNNGFSHEERNPLDSLGATDRLL